MTLFVAQHRPADLSAMPVAGWSSGRGAVLPPYAEPVPRLDPAVEVLNHVPPALVVLAVCAAVLAGSRRPTAGGLFATGPLVVCAGFWLTMTRVPLVAQAAREELPWAAASWRSVPGLVVIVLDAARAVPLGKEPAAQRAAP